MFKSRKFKYGSLATALTIGFIAIVVIINIVVGLILNRLPTNLDLTSNGIFEIGDETKGILSDLKHDITISIIGDETELDNASTYYKQISEIIKLYPKYSNRIKLSWVNLDKNPEFANKFSSEELQNYDVVIESELRYRIVNIQDMLDIDQEKYTMYAYYGQGSLEDCIKGSVAEQEMTSAVMYVSDDNPVKVAFITMGEENINFTAFRDQILGKNAYETVMMNILTEDIPEDAKIAVVCAPSKDYSAIEIAKLEAFLDNNGKSGKSVFYIAPSKNYDTPIIDEFLQSWGIQVGSEYIIETDAQKYYQTEYFTWQNIETTDYVKDLSESIETLLIYKAHPVTALFDAQVNNETEALITTNATAIKVDGTNAEGDPQQVGSKGIMNTAVVSAKTNYQNNEEKSYLFVFGSEYLFSDTTLTTDSAEYLLKLFNTTTGKSEGVSIISKSFEKETLELSEGAIGAMAWIFIAIIPAIVIIIGIVIAVKRKNR